MVDVFQIAPFADRVNVPDHIVIVRVFVFVEDNDANE